MMKLKIQIIHVFVATKKMASDFNKVLKIIYMIAVIKKKVERFNKKN